MVSRDQLSGTIVGVKGNQVVVRLDDGTEILCGGVRELHREWGFYVVPIGQKVKVSQDLATDKRKVRIIEIVK
jgi:ribosome maturation factor RimP